MTSSLVGSEMCIRDRIKRMVGHVKEHTRRILHAAVEVGPTFWPHAAMFVANAMRHNSTRRLRSQALGKVVAAVSYTHLTLPTICSV
eukprot:3145973-Prorocentrum_lima.AAC.1